LDTEKIKQTIKERQNRTNEFLHELNSSKDPRTKILLLGNYVDSLVKDLIQLIVDSKKARSIPRRHIREILKDLNIIDDDLYQDLKKIEDIRDYYGHHILSKANEESEKLITTLNIVNKILVKKYPKWNEYNTSKKMTEIAKRVVGELVAQISNMITNKLNN